jgi:hypothetical protein
MLLKGTSEGNEDMENWKFVIEENNGTTMTQQS